MQRTVLDSATREALRKAVRGLRERLLESLMQAAESEYRLQSSPEKARLPADRRARRQRLEEWKDEQLRATPAKDRKTKKAEKELRDRFLCDAVKQAASTLLNRLVFIRVMEHHGLVKPPLVTGGWQSRAYHDEFMHYSVALQGDDSRGYAVLLEMLYAELALDLPGLFGAVGLTQLFPVPAATLRDVIETLNDSALQRAWGDDTTLGWVYQFWNDPEREALDAKISSGGKIEPHEIGPKTQMFTERYMVEWLLHNSLGQMWLAMCQKHGWTPDFFQVRDQLEARRAAWRAKREAGEVAQEALMPIESELEERWKYWVPQPMVEEAVANAPSSIVDLKLLDPACGSGHFLVIAFDLLVALYEEEGAHRGQPWTRQHVAQSIVEKNLYGIDIDPRAVQIAAASLWLKAKLYAPQIELRAMNLVAPTFRLAELPKDDAAFERLCDALDGLPVTRQRKLELMDKLRGVDHLGTLLSVDREIATILEQAASALVQNPEVAQFDARAALRRWFGEFLDAHSSRAELGLRLDGEQVAAGARFLEIVRDDTYDVVMGNPPYQATTKLADVAWFKEHYPRAKADLYTCFLERSLALATPGGVSAMLTMRGWMFLSQSQKLREGLLREHHLALMADLGPGAFEDINAAQVVVSVSLSLIWRRAPGGGAVALQPTPPEDHAGLGMMGRKRAGLLAQVGRHEFNVAKLGGIEGTPLVYWWDEGFLEEYIRSPKLEQVAPVSVGLQTSDNARFLRRPWEVRREKVCTSGDLIDPTCWSPYIKGAAGVSWFEPLDCIVNWKAAGLEVQLYEVDGKLAARPQNQHSYFRLGVAFTTIGASFLARVHRYPSITGNAGASVFPANPQDVACLMNSKAVRFCMTSLNPTVNFLVGDAKRIPLWWIEKATEIYERLSEAFLAHELHREPSIEFKFPRSSLWRYAQSWAQEAVDRPKGAPLPSYTPQYHEPEPAAYASFAIGVALGRFAANGEGMLSDPPETALPAGILYVSGGEALADSFCHSATAPVVAAWIEHASAMRSSSGQELREWLRKDFFLYHKERYESRPIYFPVSSSKRNFVAFVSVHRWSDTTLQTLLARHLKPNLRQIDALIADLETARRDSDKTAARGAERQYTQTKELRNELAEFIAQVEECAERGPPPAEYKCVPREADASYHMDLDDGVMINSAALWPLLDPQWKEPKKWWKELCEAKGRKDYDWAHLAKRYFPRRVDDKCREDPSLAVAHGCFWKYHPAKAYAWELRLAYEIGPDFAIDEADAAQHRAEFLADHAEQADELRQKERDRRERLRKRHADGEEVSGPGLAKGPTSEPPENDISEAEATEEEQVA